jgi:hypothetical protein
MIDIGDLLVRAAETTGRSKVPLEQFTARARRRRARRFVAGVVAVTAVIIAAASALSGNEPRDRITTDTSAPLPQSFVATPGPDGQLAGIVGTRNGTLAYGQSRTPAIWRRDNNTWRRTLDEPGDPRPIKNTYVSGVVETSNRFVAVGVAMSGTDATAAIWSSIDGDTWTRVDDADLIGPSNTPPADVSTPRSVIDAVATDGSKLVATGSVFVGQFSSGLLLPGGFRPAIWTSDNGLDWDLALSPTGTTAAASTTYSDIVWSRDAGWLIVGDANNQPRLWRSKDLRSWNEELLASQGTGTTSTVTAEGKLIVVAGQLDDRLTIWTKQGSGEWHVAYRDNGTTSSNAIGAATSRLGALVVGWNGPSEATPRLVVLTSPNGTDWTSLGNDDFYEANAWASGGVHIVDNRFTIAGTRVTGTGTADDPIRNHATVWSPE